MRAPSPLVERKEALQRLRAGVDLRVIGGGITGAGVALDAATRGYQVALVEQQDDAGGTSGRSTKLVHGGLRYLPQCQIGLVQEALHERDRLQRLAPYLVAPLPFLVPVYRGLRYRSRRRRARGIQGKYELSSSGLDEPVLGSR